jgi:predicted ATPase
VGELVQGSAGIDLTLEAAEAIHNRTDGNPFFVGEVTRHVTLENITEDPGWASIIPEGVRDAIGRRLNRLSDHCNQMLTTASVVGQEFEFRLLNSLMSDITEDQLLAAMDEAVEVQLIEELPNSVGLYQFTHALIQETLFEELSTTRRVRLHARIAEGLETLYGNDADVHAEELAYHFAEAQTLTGPEKLVRYSLMAGQQALASYAYDDALTYFEKGLAARDIALSGTDAACDEEAADLLFGLARARSNTVSGQQLVEAFAILSRAFDYYAEAGNVAQAVAAALFPIVTPSYRIPGITGLLARALTLVPADSHEAGRILCV